MSTVSIVIPTYNRSSLLKECIKSLLAQTHPDLEILVVDDGSTDDTKQVVGSITDGQNRIRYYLRPHRGVCAARNFGLEQAGGEFICFFDHDDLWPPDYIETMVKNLQARPDFGVAYSKVIKFGRETGQHWPSDRCSSGFVTADLFKGKLFILPSAVIFRRSIWKDVNWDETLQITEDRDILLRLSMRSKFIYVPEIYALRRESSDTAGTVLIKALVDNRPRVMERFYFKLGGSSYISRKQAYRRISYRYCHWAWKHYRAGDRKASIALLKKALSYRPFDSRLYVKLLKALALNPRKDKMPDWQLPPALDRPVKSPLIIEPEKNL